MCNFSQHIRGIIEHKNAFIGNALPQRTEHPLEDKYLVYKCNAQADFCAPNRQLE